MAKRPFRSPPRRPIHRVSKEPEIDFPDPFPDPPPPVPGPATNPRGSYSEKTYTAPSTILDQVVPMIYGSQKVNGYCAAWDTSSLYLDLAFVLCFGEQNSIGSIEINDEAIGGLTWIVDYDTFVGDGTGTKPSYMGFVDAGTWAYMLDFCMVTMRVRIKNANCPGSFNLSAVPTGRKFASFVSPYTVSNYTNLAEIAYDIYTADGWKGIASPPLGTESGGTWEKFKDHCDEVMGDASKRYTFNGIITERDPDKAIDLVLQAGFASKYFSADGKVQIWSEAPPPALTDTWSNTGYPTPSTTITADASGGDATQLSSGNIILVGTNVSIVDSITDDDTIVLREAVAVSGVNVHTTSNVHLELENWVKTPEGKEVETGSIPDEVRVRYTLSDYWGSMTYPETATGAKRTEVTVEACNNASMARRISETKKNLMANQPFSWQGVADPNAAGLEPGDVFFFTDDVLAMQPARVLPTVTHTRGGNVALRFQQYDVSAVSNSTQSDPAIPSQPTSYVSGGTPHFGAINSVTSGGTAYNFFRWAGSDAYVGDDLVVQVLDGVSIRLPNNIYLLGINYAGDDTIKIVRVNSSDEIELGDGTLPIYFNGTAFDLKHNAPLRGRNYDDDGYIDIVKVTDSGTPSYTNRIFIGDTSYPIYLSSDAFYLTEYPGNLWMKDSTAAYASVVSSTSVGLTFGHTLINTVLQGITLQSEKSLYFNNNDDGVWLRNAGDSSYIEALNMNASGSDGEIEVGAASHPLRLRGSETRPQYGGNDLALLSDAGGGPGTDTSAIHDDTANEIQPITAKATPVDADVVIIEDSAASWAKKSLTMANLSSYVETDLGGPFLPLSAGSGKALTDSLYLDKTSTPSIFLREAGDTADYTTIWDNSSVGALRKIASTGAATLRLEAAVTDGTSGATVQFFRTTNTSGSRFLYIHVGDGTATVQHSFNAGSGVVELCKVAGSVTIGEGNLFIDKTDNPATSWREGGSATSYTQAYDDGWTGKLRKVEPGTVGLWLDAQTTGGTANANIQLFRECNTTGVVMVTMHQGDGTSVAQHTFDCSGGTVNLCQQAGTIQQDGVNVALSTDLSSYLLLTGGTMSGAIILENNVALHGENTSDLARSLAFVNTSNQSEFGTSLQNTLIQGNATGIYLNAKTKFFDEISGNADINIAASNVYMDNNKALSWDKFATGSVVGMKLNTDDKFEIGGGQNCIFTDDIEVQTGYVKVDNAYAYRGETSASAIVDLIKIDSGDDVVIGQTLSIDDLVFKCGTGHTFNFAGNDKAITVEESGGTARSAIKMNSSDDLMLGATTNDTVVRGLTTRMSGIKSGAGAPTTTHFPTGYWGVYRDTSGSVTYIVANYGGTIYKQSMA